MLTATNRSNIKISKEIELKRFSEKISKFVKKFSTIFLYGELGVGKTTFVKYLINTLQKKERTKITEKQIERLENEIDQLNANLSDLESFILPGGTLASSYLHLARTAVRKAERLVVKMDNLEKNSVSNTALKYINRLSDLLFVAARYANQTDIGGTGDVLWKPGSSREE